MKEKPIINTFEDGSKIWNHTFDTFKVKVYVPTTDLPEKTINYGFDAPYLLVFEDIELDNDEAKQYAEQNGLADIASANASSVVYIYPTCSGGWKNATDALWIELISKSKIHEYYEDGYAILNNRFTKECEGYAIRGAIYRTYLFGKNSSADYIATHLLKTIEGDGLWGKADIIPAGCVLEGLSVSPDIQRRDMPITSINNTASIDAYIKEHTDYYYNKSSDYSTIYYDFLNKTHRWGWHGELKTTPDLNEIGMLEEPNVITIPTSDDNVSIFKGTKSYDMGYISYYNKGLFDKGPAPLLLCFHGGGDSAKYIAKIAEWYRVANKHDFLLVCVENHLNITATEIVSLTNHLKSKYAIDESRIYATGFSMGGCKSWDLYQEYPNVFAGLAPMDATFDVGHNIFDNKVSKEINKDTLVPIFYAGGEITPLPELPFQAQKCLDRMAYVLDVNNATKSYNVKLEDKESWENSIWGINGDYSETDYDEEQQGTLTMQYFLSNDNNCYTVFASIDNQGHECRYHTCEHAWSFLSKFIRTDEGIQIIK